MKHEPLWKFSVATTPEAEEAVTELLETIFQSPAVSYTNFDTGQTTVQVYLKAWSADALVRQFRRRMEDTRGRGRPRSVVGLAINPVTISCERVRKENWAESWKRHFKPIEIGSALLIKPSWSRRQRRRGQKIIVLDPGLSFGTGHHPTTAFCLRQLVSHRRPGTPQSFLDIGTGSGILAIAAARLGYAPVEAIDSDAEAVRVARANARQNRVHQHVHIAHQNLCRIPPNKMKRYALVCANLISTLLLQERDRLIARLAPGGALVLAGILNSEFPRIQTAYQSRGLQLIARRKQNEWTSGAFSKP